MKRVWRSLARWWNRRRDAQAQADAQRAYDALVAEMRDRWRIVTVHKTPCYISSADPGSFMGNITIVAETNELNERRVRCIECPPMFRQEQSHAWTDYLIWGEKAEPTMPPRTPINVKEMIK